MQLYSTEHDESANYTSPLEVGDYVPYFYLENNGQKLDIQVKASNFLLLIFVPASIEHELLNWVATVKTSYFTFVISPDRLDVEHERFFYSESVHRLFAREDNDFVACLCDRNLKVKLLQAGSDLRTLVDGIPRKSKLPSDNIQPPVLIIPNAIAASFADELIQHANTEGVETFQSSSSYKSRDHLHPSDALLDRLDDKLSKSVLPEISKVFYSDICYREKYKICRYDSKQEGSFGKHRDTIDPYLHRRYAMTLTLNDDYQGGGICFPEYNDQVLSLPKYSAVVFPGSLYHQVIRIESGVRYVLITFFFTEIEARPGKDECNLFTRRRDTVGLRLNSLKPRVNQ